MPKFVLPRNGRSLIDVLDLAVDRRIATVGSPPRRGHNIVVSFRSSPEHGKRLAMRSQMRGNEKCQIGERAQ